MYYKQSQFVQWYRKDLQFTNQRSSETVNTRSVCTNYHDTIVLRISDKVGSWYSRALESTPIQVLANDKNKIEVTKQYSLNKLENINYNTKHVVEFYEIKVIERKIKVIYVIRESIELRRNTFTVHKDNRLNISDSWLSIINT